MTDQEKKIPFLGNIDRYPWNEDWIKMLSRDVDAYGNVVLTRFDLEAMRAGRRFYTLRELDAKRKRNRRWRRNRQEE